MKFRLVIDPTQEEEVVVTARRPSALTEQLEQLVRRHEGADTLTAYTEDEVLQLPYLDIACLTTSQGKTWAIDRHGRQYRLRQRLCDLEEHLPASFMRINKSAIANRAHLMKFKTTFSGAVDAVFTCGYTEYVSRRCFAAIKRRFGL